MEVRLLNDEMLKILRRRRRRRDEVPSPRRTPNDVLKTKLCDRKQT